MVDTALYCADIGADANNVDIDFFISANKLVLD